ncbi:hypothetical protein ACOBV8_06310 [Pseudoalteromonas espejiana]
MNLLIQFSLDKAFGEQVENELEEENKKLSPIGQMVSKKNELEEDELFLL